MNREEKKTGNGWSKVLKVEIANPTGWSNESHYNTYFITKDEFCNRAANSVVVPKASISRRDAAKFAKKKLI
jgi:hypothetical protein